MSLSSGNRLGPYEITAKLGEGGMGEVYRATDTKLKRDVAIKVLPQELAADRERLARFEREAQLLAQLHHPHIASIFGLEDANGIRALVMELVEGPTLGERLASGRLPLEESLAIAKQIAEALEGAHEKGIVHRDLKPQNIKITPEGVVKVLDFGLAKAMDAAAPETARGLTQSPTLMSSPTLTAAHGTQLGVIFGTAAYMSPEQARGHAVDKRADIWAFGVVLFEMLVGRSLFSAETVSDTLAGVLRAEIDLGELPVETPAAIRRLLRRCLERPPKNRLRDIGDARIVIDEVLARGAESEAMGSAAEPTRAPSIRRLAPWALLLLAIGAAAGWLATRPRGTASGEAPEFTLRRLTELPGAELQPTLSPDGRMLVYASAVAGNLDLYLLRVGGDRAIPLTTDPADDSQAAFSPDGERIAFRSERDGGGIFVMGATGESVRRVTDTGFDPAWSPDGRRLAYATEAVIDPVSRLSNSELWIVEVDSGKRTRVVASDAAQPAWSRRGDRLAYWANTGGQRDLWTVSADGGKPVAVTQDTATDWSPEWSPDGRWLTFSSDRGGSFNLWRIAIDPATGGAAGSPRPVTTGVRGMGYGRFSADGTRLAVMAFERSYEQTIYAVDPGEPIQLHPLRTLRNPSARWCNLSPDGTRLACSTANAPEDLLVLRTDGTEMRRLTSDLDKDRNARWDPSGRRLGFMSTHGGEWGAWVIGADGSDLRQVSPLEPQDLAWTPDGKTLTVLTLPPSIVFSDPDRPETAAPARQVQFPPDVEGVGLILWDHAVNRVACALQNPDGRAMAFAIFEPRSGAFRRLAVPAAGYSSNNLAGWLPDDRRLIVRAAGGVREVDVASGESRLLAPASPNASVSLSLDGHTLMVENEILDSDIWLLDFAGSTR